jgi:Mu transposase, C-terminal domain
MDFPQLLMLYQMGLLMPAKVEAGVLVVERWILAALRKRTFFGLGEVNQAIQELLARLNDRPFRKRDGTRRSLFEALDKPVLRTLPAQRYEYGDWETHRVNIDYHVEFDNHWYSVPYPLTQQEVEVRATATTVEVFHRGVRVSSHGGAMCPTSLRRSMSIGPRRTSGTWNGHPPA